MQIKTPYTKISAALGPTNTGKTFLAFERMLAHGSGMIGFPLRLLARENYERAVALKGSNQVALITGEEKILPPYAKYFFCTVEAMPLGQEVDFLAVDEIQLCADIERGHIFTDRLLNARGKQETMFMGADAFRPLLSQLVPEAEIFTRPRFSSLRFSGARKIAKLPARTAVVGFSANDVYAIAELIRRQRGGAAIVMGALSPRTRSSQVAMFENGDVDYLVATDAIGMGLNMGVDHVAFAALKKFDGTFRRNLRSEELGQIAGRAGRHLNDGTFGLTGNVTEISPDLVAAIENHQYDPVKQIYWRSPRLNYSNLISLSESLKIAPDRPGLHRVRQPDDERFLRELMCDEEVVKRAQHTDSVRLLWEVCQVPDYKNTLAGDHGYLLGQIFKYLSISRVIPTDWIADQVGRLGQVDGSIETLVSRIAGIRIWTYIANRQSWLDDAVHWQERTRAVEDALSDALHRGLTQRFVDQRTTSLVRKLQDKKSIRAAISSDGDVLVEGHFVGKLNGFRFIADRADGEVAGKVVTNAAFRALSREVEYRVKELIADDDTAFDLNNQVLLTWRGFVVGRLCKGGSALNPRIVLTAVELLEQPQRQGIQNRLSRWLYGHIETRLEPLLKLQDAPFSGAVRGIAFQLVEGFGVVTRKAVKQQLKALDKRDYGALRRLGIKLGRREIFIPALIKPEAAILAVKLWGVSNGLERIPYLPPPGRVSFPVDETLNLPFLRVAGYCRVGPLVLRVDILERLIGQLLKRSAEGTFVPDAEILNLAGCNRKQMCGIIESLGYKAVGNSENIRFTMDDRATKQRKSVRRKNRPDLIVNTTDSPFAKLKELSFEK